MTFFNPAAGPWSLVLYAEIFITVLLWKRRCSISQLWTPNLQAKRLLQSNYGGTVDCLCRSSPWKTNTNIARKHFIKFSGLDTPKPTYVPGFFQTNQSIINERMDTTYCLVLQEIYSTQIMFMLEMRLALRVPCHNRETKRLLWLKTLCKTHSHQVEVWSIF